MSVVPKEKIDDWVLALGADEEIVVRLHPEVPETGEVDDTSLRGPGGGGGLHRNSLEIDFIVVSDRGE